MIFERFYKQDEFVQGTGLGLSISMVIAENSVGRLVWPQRLEKEAGSLSSYPTIMKARNSFLPDNFTDTQRM